MNLITDVITDKNYELSRRKYPIRGVWRIYFDHSSMILCNNCAHLCARRCGMCSATSSGSPQSRHQFCDLLVIVALVYCVYSKDVSFYLAQSFPLQWSPRVAAQSHERRGITLCKREHLETDDY